MIGAILQLIIVLVVVGFLYWALTQLWPLGAPATSSRVGQAIYILLIILLVFCVIWFGVIPLIGAIPSAFGSGVLYRH